MRTDILRYSLPRRGSRRRGWVLPQERFIYGPGQDRSVAVCSPTALHCHAWRRTVPPPSRGVRGPNAVRSNNLFEMGEEYRMRIEAVDLVHRFQFVCLSLWFKPVEFVIYSTYTSPSFVGN